MAAILRFRLPVTSGSILNSAIELLDLENGGLAVGTAFLSCLEAEIYVLSVYWPPSWISDFRLHRAVSALSLFGSRTQTTWWWPLAFRWISSRNGDGYLNSVYEMTCKHYRFCGRHLEFVSFACICRHRYKFHCVLGPRKPWGSRWNFIAILSRSGDIKMSCFTAAILDLPLPVTSGSIHNSTI